MNRVWGKALVLTGLILMLGGAPSWGAPPNNDVSDAAGNTAGGVGFGQSSHERFSPAQSLRPLSRCMRRTQYAMRVSKTLP
jgi:hypothetical protein